MTTSLPGLTPGTWTVDSNHSEVGFVARHLMVAKVRGRFTNVSGTVTVTDPIEQSTVEVTAQMDSIDTRTADRDTHLKSADFFDIEKYPTMTFKSTSFDGKKLTGDLTIKDVTKPVTFDVEFSGVQADPWGATKAGFEAEANVDRTDWGLTWNAALEGGGVLVGEKVKLVIDVELLKTP